MQKQPEREKKITTIRNMDPLTWTNHKAQFSRIWWLAGTSENVCQTWNTIPVAKS